MDFLGITLVILVFALFISVPIAMLAFWIMMLVHAAKNDIRDQAIWILVIALAGIVGAIIYYFVVKRPYEAGDPKARAPKTAA